MMLVYTKPECIDDSRSVGVKLMINNWTMRNRLCDQVWAMVLAILMTVLLGQAATANVLTPVVQPSGLNPSAAAQDSLEPALIPALAEWAKQLQAESVAAPAPMPIQTMSAPDPRWLETLISGVDPTLLQPLAWQTTLGGSPAMQPVKADPAVRARVLEAFGRTPLHFEPNQGQTDPAVKFLARTPGYQLLLTPKEAVLAVRGQTQESSAVVRMQLTGAGVNPQPVVEGLAALPGRSHYYLGNDPQRWQTEVPHFAKVRYGAVYPGVDWELYGNPRQLEYDFVVAPGADPNLINLSFAGADGARLDADGQLVVAVAGQEVLHSSPTIYQVVKGERQIVAGGYVLRESAGDAPVVGFEIAAYDRELPLVIDPIIYFDILTCEGVPCSNEDEFGWDITVDSLGNAYITGSTASNNFLRSPTARWWSQAVVAAAGRDFSTFSGVTDAFIVRLDIGGMPIYTTYLGGNSFDYGYGIALDNQGNFYITGSTRSNDFPIISSTTRSIAASINEGATVKITTGGSFLPPATPGTAYPAASGTLTASGGQCTPIATCTVTYTWALDPSTPTNLPAGWSLSAAGVLSGTSAINDVGTYNFIVSVRDNFVPPNVARMTFTLAVGGVIQNQLKGTQDAFVSKFDVATGRLVYSTYLGGSTNTAGGGGVDSGRSIIVNHAGNAYITGYTNSSDFPNALAQGGGDSPFDPTYNNLDDVFVAKLSVDGISLVYSTYLGGSGDERGNGIVLDAEGNAYITGYTDSPNFPNAGGLTSCLTRLGANNNYEEVFVTKLNAAGNGLIYSTCFGGRRYDRGQGIDIDAANNVYIVGYTDSPSPSVAEAINTYSVDNVGFDTDAFVARLNPNGTLLQGFFRYLGGNANDIGNAIAVDCCGSMGTYVTGYTSSPDFPLMRSDDPVFAGGTEAFITRLDSAIPTPPLPPLPLTYSSFFGGDRNDYGMGIALDAALDVYVTGYTNTYKADSFPVLPDFPPQDGVPLDPSFDYNALAIKVSIPTVFTDFNLAVHLQGGGSGSVVSVPQGIGQTAPCHMTNGVLDSAADCYASYPINTSVTLTATPDASFAFVGWAGAGSGTCAGSVALTCVVLMDEAKTVVANFAPANSLTVIKAGTGSGTVTSSPVGINCGAACLSDNSTFSTGTVVTLTATVQPGSTFAGWTNAISPFECNNSTSLTCQVTISTAKSVTATFTLDQFTLTVSKAGAGAATGTVTSSPAGINCGLDCTESYAQNTLVTLTATAGTGFTFTGWTAGACTGTDPCAVTMDDAKSVTATFLPNRTLSVTKSGNGTGTVTSSPAGINCGADCTEVYAPGTSVALTAAAGVNATFVGWSGACTGTGVCTVTMDAAESVDAQFNITNELSVVVQAATGSSGAVSSIPGGIDCSDAGLGSNCSEVYALNTMVTLTAAAGSNSAFVGWGGLCSGTIPTCVVSINGAQNLTAYFAPLLSVTVIKSGAGSGTVSSSPVGIDCGADCQQSYAQNTLVTLTATAQLGSTFGGWSGSCAGTETTCQVLVNAAKTVTADFIVSPQSFSLTAVKNGDGTGTVTSTPNGITCGAVCQASYAEDTVVSLTTTPGAGSAFEGWGGACLGTETGDPCKVTMTANQSVTARFTKIDPNLPDLVIPTLTSPGLSANGQRNVSFALTVKNQGAKVTGAFQVGLYFTLDDSVDPALDLNAGKVCSFTSLAVGATASCSGNIVLPAGLPAAGGYYLGAYADPQGNIKELSKDNNAAVTNTVNGVPTPKTFTVYQLTTVINRPGNGTVYSQPSGIACSVNTNCQIPLLAGDSVTLTATPATGFVFAGWSGACTGADVCNLIMSANRNVTANFSAKKAQTIGLYNPAVARFYLRNSNSAGASNITFSYGPANQGWIPLVGDWDGNGTQTIGLYNPAVARFYLRNSNSAGASNITFSYGRPTRAGYRWSATGTATAPKLSACTTRPPPASTCATATAQEPAISPSATDRPTRAGCRWSATGTATARRPSACTTRPPPVSTCAIATARGPAISPSATDRPTRAGCRWSATGTAMAPKPSACTTRPPPAFTCATATAKGRRI
jgi:uncharacterized repeat protein (TIGR02543 family)